MNDPKPISIANATLVLVPVSGFCEQHGDWSGHARPERAGRCPDCLKSELMAMNEQRDQDSRESQVSTRARALGIPLRYGNAAIAEIQREAREKLSAWAKSRTHSLVITGPVGVGKTYAACALALLCQEANATTKYTSQASILRAIRSTWGTRAERSEEGVWRELTTPSVLIVDDIGAARGNDNDAMRISELIDERYNEQKPTVLVTNLKPEQLKVELGDRAYDRICEGGKLIVMGGESRRKAAP